MATKTRKPKSTGSSQQSVEPPVGHATRTPTLLSPRTFLKASQPERFSDSVQVLESRLPRSILEYHLHTLTNRSQETGFEQFARKLSECEVCPNLLPHTGPTGGGDSKVDSETFPVAEQLALAWCAGIGQQAAQERWAFAFSAKSDWKPKVRSDIAKLAATGRGYTKAFFVSNQFIPDKDRAQVEDVLRTQYGLDVRIFDRSWILDRVYSGHHEQLAIDELHLDIPERVETQKGPFDTAREKSLADAERKIELAVREGRIGPALVDDMLHSAILARALERQRSEIEGYFARARKAAEQIQSSHHLHCIAYQEAFTAFFWFEDYPSFLAKLSDFDQLVHDTDNISDLQRATTLWSALWTGTTHGFINRSKADLIGRTKRLLTALDTAARDTSRPSSALEAEGLAIKIRLIQSPPAKRNDLLAALRGVIERSSGLLGFPMLVWVDLITELGSVLGDLPAYDELFAVTAALAGERQGEVVEAQLLLKRGAQQLDAKKPSEAIRFVGQALARLYKEECRDDLIHALYLIGVAYDQVGLLWAARGSLLSAASIAVRDFHLDGAVTDAQCLCFDRIRWLELRLGRLPHALAWHELTQVTKHALAQHGTDIDSLRAGDEEFDGTLGILLLRTDFWELKLLEYLPDTLDNHALH